MKTELSRLLIEGGEKLGISIKEKHLLIFGQYIEKLREWGKFMNLTGRFDEREIILKDFLDSLTVLKHLPKGTSVIDVGSGAGFPGVPLKIIRPDLRIVLLEATRKKVYFLKNLVRHLGLERVEVHWLGELRENENPLVGAFDFVISRALGSLHKFCTIGYPFLKRGGVLLAMKGKKGEAELRKDRPAIKEMGFDLGFFDRLRLPFLGHERILIGLRKV